MTKRLDISSLLKDLGEGGPDKRRRAIHELTRLKPSLEGVKSLLLLALGDEDFSIKNEAALLLAEWGYADENVISILSGLWSDESQRHRSVNALTLLAPKCAEASLALAGFLVEVMGNEDEYDEADYDAVCCALAVTPQNIDPLLEKLLDHDKLTRKLACIALGHSGLVLDKTTPLLLLMLLLDEDKNIRIAARECLWDIKPPEGPLVKEFFECMKELDKNKARQTAAGILRDVRHDTKEGAELLLRNLRNENPLVRWFSLSLLGWLRENSENEVLPIYEVFENGEPFIRYAAARALARIGAETIRGAAPLIEPQNINRCIVALKAMGLLAPKPDLSHML